MEKHFRRHITDFLPGEGCLPNDPAASPEIEGHLREAIIHGQHKSVSLQAPFISQCFRYCFAECDAGIFYTVMLVDVEIATAL